MVLSWEVNLDQQFVVNSSAVFKPSGIIVKVLRCLVLGRSLIDYFKRDRVTPSVLMFHLRSYSSDFHEILYSILTLKSRWRI